VIDATPPQLSRLGDLVTNIRAFDGLARQVWGGDAWLTTEIDGTLVKIDKTRVALARAVRQKQATKPLTTKLRTHVTTLDRQTARLRKGLEPYNAMAKDLLASLSLNMQLLHRVVKGLR
jgi:hypothetical protein